MPTYAVKLLAAGLLAWIGFAALAVTQSEVSHGVWLLTLQEMLFWAGILLLGSTLLAYVLGKHAAELGEQRLPPEPVDEHDESWAPHGSEPR